MKIIVTTSNNYHHLLPVFFYCLNKNMPGEEVILLGYDKPTCTLPDNVKFESMGTQGPVNEWSTDLRKYFEAQEDEWFIWMMEDSFIRSVNQDTLIDCVAFCMPGVGRVALTKDILNREHVKQPGGIVYAHPNSRYRLSTQPSIWNKEFLLTYLTDGLTPWEMETQDPMNDGWHVVGHIDPPIVSNEGVTKRDIHKLDLNGFSEEDINHIKTLL